MKNNMTILSLIALLTFSVACETPKEQLADIGLFGEHQLLRYENFIGIQGSVSGSFFGLDGSISSGSTLQFWWSPVAGEVVSTAMPYSKFKFVIDDTKETPTVEFIFDPRWLNDDAARYSYDEYEKLDINSFVLSRHLRIVRIKISQAMLEQEIYLPKP